MKHSITDTFSYNVIYVYTIPDESHQGRVKIGETSLKIGEFDGLSEEAKNEKIRQAAKKRIDQQTKTADIEYELLHCELAITKNKNVFRDYKVHEILHRSGHHKKSIRRGVRDWYEVPLDIALAAIKAAKEERESLSPTDNATETVAFPFRESQRDAIEQTIRYFRNKKGAEYLWNAKMRFGKTTAAMQVAKEKQFGKTLIITHRPAVQDGWFDDFKKIFVGTDVQFGSKSYGEKLPTLIQQDKPFVYFASIQDLRESEGIGGRGFHKNHEVFDTDWDFLIVDEAHEGTQSALGAVLGEKIRRNFTLLLSGTPFNLLEKREADEVYTWDYVMEQEAKERWDDNHPGESNPYAELPKLSMFTYKLNKYIEQPDFQDIEDKAFNFKEFFRTNENEQFIHEPFVKKFLDLLTKNQEFPFSTEEYQSYLKHTLWFVPGVKEAKALKKLLEAHPIFCNFGIANVAGTEEIEGDALRTVRQVIAKKEYTITISCGKLTLGVNVPEWTAVFMLSNTKSATTYLQTAFRCQTPACIDGKMKTQCYVFDFAPDRTLQIVAEAAELRTKAGETNRIEQKKYMEKFLNFCPVIAATLGAMESYDVGGMLQELKKAAIARVVRNGFEDKKLYNDNLLKDLSNDSIVDFEKLKKIVGTSSGTLPPSNQLVINFQGFDEAEIEKAGQDEKKPKRELTEEEKERLRKLKEARELAEVRRSILRGISVRMPLLLFGAETLSPETEISLRTFVDIVDDQSWKEYMPRGVTKEVFRKFIKYYDEDVFVGAGLNIRRKVLACDQMMPFERCETIAEIFAMFRNPDKETVLTPWKTVNTHLSDTLGGADFTKKDEVGLPVYSASSYDGGSDFRILEINAKSGLYPLLAAYNLYFPALQKTEPEEHQFRDLWAAILEKNIFVVCKTPMAASISKRTLAGFTGAKVNVAYIPLVPPAGEQGTTLIADPNFNFQEKLTQQFNLPENMQFDIIIGNPPYQQADGAGGQGSSAKPVYQHFIRQAKRLNPRYLSLIVPARWFTGGKGLDDFRKEMLADTRIRVLHDYPDEKDCFPNVEIKGGICYFLWDRDHSGKCKITTHVNGEGRVSERTLHSSYTDTFIRFPEQLSVVEKVWQQSESMVPKSFDHLVSVRKPFGLASDFRNFNDKPFDGAVKIFANKSHGFIQRNKIERNTDWIDRWKVYITFAYGAGSGFPHQILNKPFLGEPNTCTTETNLVIGPFDDKQTAENVMCYINTRFFRFLVLIKKLTQNATKEVYQLVPLQDFSESWSDEKLYKKYHLTTAEIDFIENMVRAMP